MIRTLLSILIFDILSFIEDVRETKMDDTGCCQSIQVSSDDTHEEYFGDYLHFGSHEGYPKYRFKSGSTIFHLHYKHESWVISGGIEGEEMIDFIASKGHSICPDLVRGPWVKFENGESMLGLKIGIACNERPIRLGMNTFTFS